MPGMNSGLNSDNPTLVAAFRSALLHQGIIVLAVFVVLALAWAASAAGTVARTAGGAAIAALACGLAAGCGTTPAPRPGPAAVPATPPPLVTSFAGSAGAGRAIVEMGGSAAEENNLWELFVRPARSAPWRLTPGAAGSAGPGAAGTGTSVAGGSSVTSSPGKDSSGAGSSALTGTSGKGAARWSLVQTIYVAIPYGTSG
jgi:hypothetical protein